MMMDDEVNVVNGDGNKGVGVMGLSVEEMALAVFDEDWGWWRHCWMLLLVTEGLDVMVLAVWVGG